MHRTPAVPDHCAVAFADAAVDVEWPQPTPIAAESGRVEGSTPQRRDRFAGTLAGRRAAAEALRFARVEQVELLREPGRAPRALVVADGERRDAGLALSLSHCEGRAAAVAAPRATRVGIDLERVGRVPAEHERYFLTAAERRAAGRHDSVALWTLKEAAWKALELASDVPFHDLELGFDAGGSVRSVRCGVDVLPASASLSRPWPGFVLAVLWLERADA